MTTNTHQARAQRAYALLIEAGLELAIRDALQAAPKWASADTETNDHQRGTYMALAMARFDDRQAYEHICAQLGIQSFMDAYKVGER